MQQPRKGWEEIVTKQGLTFPTTDLPDGSAVPYWNESAWYEFTQGEVDRLERSTEELWGMSLEACSKMATDLDDARLRLPAGTLAYVRDSIRRKDPTVYGRFDLRFEGDLPKLLELNGDTPTGLVETGVVQWMWKEATLDEADQWNSLHERLIDRWRALRAEGSLPGDVVHFLFSEDDTSGEEEMTTWYMSDCAMQAGLTVTVQPIQQIAWNDHPSNPHGPCFLDANGDPVRSAYKLYPWEAILSEQPAGDVLLNQREQTPIRWVEPAWKVLLSTKALLPVLWEMYPDHPLLLPAYFDHPHDLTEWVAKPLQGREGDNIVVHRADGSEQVNPGGYGDDALVYQGFAELPNFIDNGRANYAMIGSWGVDGEAAGMMVRESDGPVTDYYSRVVPHVIGDGLEPSIGQQTLWRHQRVTENVPSLPQP